MGLRGITVRGLLKLFGQMEEAETGWQPGRER
jgi:hypothetical protein